MRFTGAEVARYPDTDPLGVLVKRVGVVFEKVVEALFYERCNHIAADLVGKLLLVLQVAYLDDWIDFFFNRGLEDLSYLHVSPLCACAICV